MRRSDHPRRALLRPRAGGIATALFIAGLAVSAAATHLGAPFIEPLQARSAANHADQAANLPARPGG